MLTLTLTLTLNLTLTVTVTQNVTENEYNIGNKKVIALLFECNVELHLSAKPKKPARLGPARPQA